MPERSATTNPNRCCTREWLVTNGLGGYASGTVAGVTTRRYHGLLIAALPAPLGRMMMLNHLSSAASCRAARRAVRRRGAHGAADRHGAEHLVEFRLEAGLPVWRYAVDGMTLEKRVCCAARQNTVHVNYRLLDGERHRAAQAAARRSTSAATRRRSTSRWPSRYALTVVEATATRSAAGPELPPLRMLHVRLRRQRTFTVDGGAAPRACSTAIEAEPRLRVARRAVEPRATSASTCSRTATATLIASTEPWDTILALTPDEARRLEHRAAPAPARVAPPPAPRTGSAAELVLAADQFLITPAGRVADTARAHAAGDEARTVIAGYHWFTDWGRDTMISLEGLTLATGRHAEAGYILRTFAHYVRDGLIPNLFPEGENEGLYHTADATLWFFHALDRYLAATGDRDDAAAAAAEAAATSSSTTSTAPASASASIRATACCAGRGGLSAHLDGRQGRRLGRDAAARQGGRDQRALVQRAAPAAKAGCATTHGDAAADDIADAGRAGARVVQPPLLVRRRRLSLRRGRRRAAATTRRSGRTRSSRSRSTTRCSTGERWQPVVDAVATKLLTPVGLRSLAPGEPGLQAALLRRPARARRGLSPGHGLGLADRPVHRRLAASPSRRRRGRARLPGRVRAASRRGRASARSARSSTPSRRSRRAAASRRPGASPRCCAALVKTARLMAGE